MSDIVDQQSSLASSLECLQSLDFMTMPTASQDPVEGTGEWIFENDKYQCWLEQGGILLINGRTGVGKSTLVRQVIDRAKLNADKTNSVVLSFFFSRRSELQGSALGLVRCLLHQILSANAQLMESFLKDTHYIKKCKASGRPGDKWDWELSKLRPLLEQYIREVVGTQNVSIFVDAFDQCEDSGMKSIVDMLHRLSETSKASVRICVSSAPFRKGNKRVVPPSKCSFTIELQIQQIRHQEVY